jgi:hypothetical protein
MRFFPNMKTKYLLAAAMIAALHAETIPSGTVIHVRTNDSIDARDTAGGRVYSGAVSSDVLDAESKLVIPRGADVELMVRDIGNHTLALASDTAWTLTT